MNNTTKQEREERLAKQLRANLAKRKAQTRARETQIDKSQPPCPDPAQKTS